MDNNSLINHSKKWDRTGLIISALCVAHCIGLPFLVILVPATGLILHSPLLEAILLVVAILVGSLSFFTTYKTHRKLYPMLTGSVGVALMIASLFLSTSHNHTLDHTWYEQINFTMMAGGFFLILGHAWNIYACHCFCDTSCDHAEHSHHQSQQA